MSQLEIFLLDKFNNAKSEINIIKPKSFQDLLKQLKQNLTNISEYFEIFMIDTNNNEIKIDTEEKYSKIQDILFIRPADKSILEQSFFQRNFDKLSESNQDILAEKFTCNICTNIIKKENPYLCYKCQKIFHEKCIKNWDKKCKFLNKKFECPAGCKNELPIEEWNKKLNFEENRNDNANLMNRINEYKLKENMNNNMNIIKDKKIKDLKENDIKQNDLIKKYEEYIGKTVLIFKNLLNKINLLNESLYLENNNKLNNLINSYSLSLNNLNIDEVSNVINEELDKFIIHIKNNCNNNINIDEEIIKNNKQAMEKINGIFGLLTTINNSKIGIQNYLNDVEKLITVKDIEKKKKQNNEINIKNNNLNNNKLNNDNNVNNNKINNNENKKTDNNQIKEKQKKSNINTSVNKINLIYFVKSEGNYNIFGWQFVQNNKDNIELIINGEEKILNSSYKLKKRENIISIVIKKNLTNLSKMFYDCKYLRDISDLKYLDVSEVKDFSYMFCKSSSLADIKALENWDVSNCNTFESMFQECPLLSDIKPLQNWNVSNSKNFKSLFSECSLLKDIKPLENWNVSNVENFSNMFSGCSSLKDIKDLEKWNVSNCKDFSSFFKGFSNLTDISFLKSWNVSNCKNFSNMFSGCSSLIDIRGLENWNVSNAENFSNFFYECSSLTDIKPLKNWNVSNCKDFSNMFSFCSKLSDIKSLKNWNVSNIESFARMFCCCQSLKDIKSLENWNVSNGDNFEAMFNSCVKLEDIEPLKKWNVSNGDNFKEMFSGCKALKDIKALENWNVSNISNFNDMFEYCNREIDISPLQNWKVSKEKLIYLK